MHNRIFIEEDKEFSLDEFAHLVARAIRSVASIDIDKEEIVYSRDDVYFTIVDVLGYINERTPGRFKIDQSSFQNYIIHFLPDGTRQTKANRGLLVSKANSAIQIREMTGNLPIWATNNEALMELIDSMDNTPKDQPAKEPLEKIINNRALVAVQIHERTGKMPEWVDNDPKLKAKVESLITEEETNEQEYPF